MLSQETLTQLQQELVGKRALLAHKQGRNLRDYDRITEYSEIIEVIAKKFVNGEKVDAIDCDTVLNNCDHVTYLRQRIKRRHEVIASLENEITRIEEFIEKSSES